MSKTKSNDKKLFAKLKGGENPQSLVELVQHRAALCGEQVVYTFVTDSNDRDASLTANQLEVYARALGARLQQEGGAGRPAILLCPPGLEYTVGYWGALFGGAVAVPAYPPDPKRMARVMPRLQAIIDDCDPPIALSTASIIEAVKVLSPASKALSKLRWIALDRLDLTLADTWINPNVNQSTLAFLQYTSGSTASPKGVMVSHGNLIHNMRATYRAYHGNSTLVSWLPPFHDMGLIGNLLQVVYGAGWGHFMAPVTFLRRPFRWLETLSRTRAAVGVAPNSAYDLCVRKISDAELAQLDLSDWRQALNGAEPIRAQTIDRFCARFAATGFRRSAFQPCYGLAEATLHVTGELPENGPRIQTLRLRELERRKLVTAAAGDRDSIVSVSCGKPVDSTRVEIVDPDTRRRCARDEVGEVWVSSPSVALGYWNRPEETEKTFHAQLTDSQDRTLFMRTGDLGFLDSAGELHISGRLKDVIIHRGRNLYPQDIEVTAEQAHEGLRAGGAAVFGILLDGSEEVVVAQEIEARHRTQAPAMLAAIRRALAQDGGVEVTPHAVFLVRAGSLPKTSSGKIQRQACARQFLNFEFDIVAASVGSDNIVAPAPSSVSADDAVIRALGKYCDRTVDLETRLAHAGLNYGRLYDLRLELEQVLGRAVPLGPVLVEPTVAGLIRAANGDAPATDSPPGAARATAPQRSAAEVERWMVDTLSIQLGLAREVIDVEQPFANIGLDSSNAVALAERLSRYMGYPIAPTLVWERASIRAAARHIVGEAPAQGADAARIEREAAAGHAAASMHEPIAIVGIGCRFPAAPDPASFWAMLRDGREGITEVPPGRWPASDVDAMAPASRWGGFLDGIDRFEPQIFGLCAREAERMDPQQRLLLEVAWEALENAGVEPTSLAGSDTGVFAAISNQEYWSLQLRDESALDIHACTGNSSAVAANRISYTLDLRGPSIAIDTACSASLVSVHLACESLRRNECSRALAGGVNLMVTPVLTGAFTRARMLSPTGRCRSFDEGADGYVRGEGCGIVVLERLSDAVKNGSRIIALIRGSAVLHNGRSNGLTAPSGEAQLDVIRRALAVSGIAAGDVDFVEAHGTGTPLGDPVEARALAQVYGANRPVGDECVIGSVKTNIGHLESAAGIAGLIKAALCLDHDEIPPQLYFNVPNSNMSWDNAGLRVAQHTVRLPQRNRARNAGVSSFGFGGTVAHLILAEAPAVPNSAGIVTGADDNRTAPAEHVYVLPLSARVKTSLVRQAEHFAQHLHAHTEQSLDDICFTAAVGRTPMAQRIAVVGDSRATIGSALLRAAQEIAARPPADPAPPGNIAFCFTGQGSQFPAMAREILRSEPVARDIVARCNALAEPQLGYSLFDLLANDMPDEVLQDTAIQQPLLYALQCALAQLWQSWGVFPDAVLGHSIGEYAAAHVAGIMDLEDGMRLVLARAKIMANQDPIGGMAACVGDISQVVAALADFDRRLWVAAHNAPNNLVVSGFADAIAELSARAIPGVTIKPLRVSHAFHSPLVDGAIDDLRQAVSKLSLEPPRLPFISNLGGRVFVNIAPAADHFSDHLRNPVDFQASVLAAAALDCRVFIEIGPGRTLLGLARECVGVRAEAMLWLPSILRSSLDRSVVRESLARFWEAGGEVNWEGVDRGRARRRVAVPTYAFTRDRYWSEPVTATSTHESHKASAPAPSPALPVSPMWTRPAPASAPVMWASTLELFRAQTAVLQQLIAIGAPAAETQTPAPGSTSSDRPAAPTPSSQAVLSAVVAQLSRISGTPAHDIQPTFCLIRDLGFDSLMRIELDRAMLLAWPQLAAVDRMAIGVDPTVAEISQLVCVAIGAGIAAPTFTAPVIDAACGTGGDPYAEKETPMLSKVTTTIVPEHRFEDSPEYAAMLARMNAINATGANPYGRIHEGHNARYAELEGRRVLNFASFNYCSLSNHPQVCAAAKAAIDTYGTSPSATPLLFGETPLHRELENEIAAYLGTEASLVFASGHGTSVAVIGHVMDSEDLVIHDQLIHDCAIRGAILSGARRRSFQHDNWQELDRVLGQIRSQFRRVLIVIEGVYSQDGDIATLPEFIRIKKKHHCMLMIDEAHSIGVLGATGAGVGEHFGVKREDVDIWMGTLSKGLGSCGGYVAGSHNFITFLKYTTPLFIFSTGITPANAAAALEAIRVLRQDSGRVGLLQEKCAYFLAAAKKRGLNTGVSFGSPIVPIIVGSWDRAMRLSNALKMRDINVMPIGYPAVEKDKCRLRFFVNVDHSYDELRHALDTLLDAIQDLDGRRDGLFSPRTTPIAGMTTLTEDVL